jgi:hypothetical protein
MLPVVVPHKRISVLLRIWQGTKRLWVYFDMLRQFLLTVATPESELYEPDMTNPHIKNTSYLSSTKIIQKNPLNLDR